MTVKGRLAAQGRWGGDAQRTTNSSANAYRGASADALNGEVFGLAFLYGETKAHATVDVLSGAKIEASDLTLDARNSGRTRTNMYAFSTGDARRGRDWPGPTADVSSHAQIEKGADIQVTDTVSVTALNNNSFNSKRQGEGPGRRQGRGGGDGVQRRHPGQRPGRCRSR